jgi:UDPglucose 6-dehydrogenase
MIKQNSNKLGEKVGIIGKGYVGGTIARFYKGSKAYDKYNHSDSLEDVLNRDYIFICVPTPSSEKGFDRSILDEVMTQVAESGKEKIVIIKSTVLPGTTDYYQELYPHLKMIFNPEFLTQNTGDHDFSFPDRQIVGHTEKSFRVAKDVINLLPLAPFERIIPAKVAEMTKYFGNTWFSTKVVFANQMYDLCRKLGIEYDHVKECAAADKRIDRTHLDIFHKGYRGYGGACLPKDTQALIAFAEELGVELALLKKVEEINNKLREELERY